MIKAEDKTKFPRSRSITVPAKTQFGMNMEVKSNSGRNYFNPQNLRHKAPTPALEEINEKPAVKDPIVPKSTKATRLREEKIK